MHEYLVFTDRWGFRAWLEANCLDSKGVWLLFGKKGAIKTLKASEALEEALCFGWIDGALESLGDEAYVKYFSMRVKNSKWSEKNKALAESLEAKGLMAGAGRAKIAQAKENGQWAKPKAPQPTEGQVAFVSGLLSGLALANFAGMPPSVQKTYARAYFDAKTSEAKARRLEWLNGRLEKNLKPMDRG